MRLPLPLSHSRGVFSLKRSQAAQEAVTARCRRILHGSCKPRCIVDLPDEIHAVHIRHVGSGGGPQALEMTTLPMPCIGEHDVLIKVVAAVRYLNSSMVHSRIGFSLLGINRPDILQRSGIYPPPPGHSPIPGEPSLFSLRFCSYSAYRT